MIGWSVSALVSAGASEIVIACAPEHAQLCRDATGDAHLVQLVDGGATRTASVRAGLATIGDVDAILVHDAARPGLEPEMIRALLAKLEFGAAAVAPALALPDTLRRADTAQNDRRHDPLTFSSSNARVASITPDGRLRAVAPGRATIPRGPAAPAPRRWCR